MRNLILNSRLTRPISFFLTFLMVNVSVPYSALGETVRKNQESAKKLQDPVRSRLLTVKDMQRLTGKNGGNPYLAGTAKFDVVHKGVNLRTGNMTMSATDMSFEGGFGVPAALTRTYSANCVDESVLGIGWSFGADLRTTAGALMKSPGAPNRSAPVRINKRPSAETDPNNALPSYVSAVIITDAAGEQHSVQRDVDGILTPAAGDANRMKPVWEKDSSGKYRLESVTLTTPEGTEMVYEELGNYPNGVVPWNNWSATPEEVGSPVLKIKSVTDRHGNTTTYTYGGSVGGTSYAGNFRFIKSNGATDEQLLTKVEMPGGRIIEFTYGTYSLGGSLNGARLASIVSNGKSVTYAYDSYHRLTSVTTPGGKATSFSYAQAKQSNSPSTLSEESFISTITDPRGLSMTYDYCFYPYSSGHAYEGTVVASRLTEPNGLQTYFFCPYANAINPEVPSGAVFSSGDVMTNCGFAEYKYDSNHTGAAATVYEAYFKFFNDSGTAYKVWWHKENSGNDPVFTERVYDVHTLNLDSETRRWISYDGTNKDETVRTCNWNFLGGPLLETVVEKRKTTGSTYDTVRTFKTDHAYWQADKFYQQKAVRVDLSNGAGTSYRYSYTDYYDTAAADGLKGMRYRVYDAKYGNVTVTNSSDWRNTVGIGSGGVHAAEFSYDSDGRVTSVKKLAPSGSSYVETLTTYGSSSSPAYGAASSVTEDYGSGKINRTTTTDQWAWNGKPQRTTDAASRQFTTTWDNDDLLVQKVTKTGSPNVDVVVYTYGTSGVSNGQPLTVQDNLGQVKQTLTYESGSVPSKGAVKTVLTEGTVPTSTSITNTVTYLYTDYLGDKEYAHYSTPNGNTKWHYSGHFTVGYDGGPQRLFGAMNRQSGVTSSTSSGSDSAEQFLYYFDILGRLVKADFALSLRSGETTYSDPWGDYTYEATKPARLCEAAYEYDSGGRCTSVSYGWADGSVVSDHWVYTWTNIRRYEAVYNDLGLKSAVYTKSGSGWSTTDSSKTQTYAYEAERDFLTSVTYAGTTTDTWEYDAAGNRSSENSDTGFTYDNLNRMSASPGHTYQHSGGSGTVGCRTFKDLNNLTNARKYTWDDLNRMLSCRGDSVGSHYRYRADGLRVTKIDGITMDPVYDDEENISGWYDNVGYTNMATWRYYYDGQMPIEEDYTHTVSGSARKDVTKLAIGARGLDASWYTEGTGSEQEGVFPFYDTHGNNVASLSRAGSSPYYSFGNERTYDAWGVASSNSPQQGYCASLGHRQDDESGLQYMRARYYEPQTGRFISEDPARDGINWHTYCSNNPVNRTDFSGLAADWLYTILQGIKLAPIVFALVALHDAAEVCHEAKTIAMVGMFFLGLWFVNDKIIGDNRARTFGGVSMAILTHMVAEEALKLNLHPATTSVAAKATAVAGAYTLILTMFIYLEFTVHIETWNMDRT